MLKQDYPGRLTREEWRALPRDQRLDIAKRAECDILKLWRDCPTKSCRRARRCTGADPLACELKHWPKIPKKVKLATHEARMRYNGLADL